MKHKIAKRFLILIIIASAILNFWTISAADPLNDETLYGFRAIGMMDFDASEYQTTPLEWFDPNVPFWAKLSFHDHPPLVFFTQFISFKIFGENNFGLRFPSALLGVISVYLIYLLTFKLYSGKAGLISAAIFGLTYNHLYISRLGMQEAFVIFFLLLASYLFIKALEKDKYFLWLGLALGLAFLTKYNCFILAPIFVTYLLMFNRRKLLSKKLWLGAIISLAIFSPVIIYNIFLYRAVGHFDFQFSYIFGQDPEAWKYMPGKETGGILDRLAHTPIYLFRTQSPVFLAAFIASFVSFIFLLARKTKETLSNNSLIVITIAYLTALVIIFIGPAYRFLAMLTPFMAIGVGALFASALTTPSPTKRKILSSAFAAIIVFEIFFSINNLFIYGFKKTDWLSTTHTWQEYKPEGYSALGKYFDKEFSGKMPLLSFNVKYKFLSGRQEKYLAKAVASGAAPYPAIVIVHGEYDSAERMAKLWALEKHGFYHGWPIVDWDTYIARSQGDVGYLLKNGFKNVYLLTNTASSLPSEAGTFTGEASATELFTGQEGEKSLIVYKKDL